MSTFFYGGAFDPLTLAHQNIIKKLIDGMSITDHLIIGITNHNYNNKNFRYSYIDRSTLVADYCASLKGPNTPMISIVKQDRRSFEFFKLYPSLRFVAIGDDEWIDLINKKWHYSDELLDKYNFIIFPRTNNISSTRVKQLLDDNMPFEYLKNFISEEVYKFIND